MLHCRDLLDLAALLSSLHARAHGVACPERKRARHARAQVSSSIWNTYCRARAGTSTRPHAAAGGYDICAIAPGAQVRRSSAIYSCRLGAPQLLPARCSFRS